MLILGLLLVVLSGAVAVLLIIDNLGGAAQTVSMFGNDLADVTVMQAFVAGLIVAAVFLIGLSMMLSAGRRARENRSRYRAARKETKAVAAERDELAKQLDTHEPVGTPADSAPTPAVGVPAQPPPVGPRHAVPGQQPVDPRYPGPGQQPVTNVRPGDTPAAR